MAAVKAFLIGLLTTEPTLVIGAAVAIVGAVIGSLGLVIPAASVATVVTYVVTVLIGAVVTRTQVSPK